MERMSNHNMGPMAGIPTNNPDPIDIPDRYKLIYATLAARQSNRETMLWQVPTLSFTAQAFLFTISLGSSTSETARLIACGLSVVVAVLSLHVLIRHRSLEVNDSEKLKKFEERIFSQPTDKVNLVIHKRLKKRHPFIDWFRSSYHIWIIGLLLVLAASFLVLFLAIFAPSLLR
jgi:hypothetical protein